MSRYMGRRSDTLNIEWKINPDDIDWTELSELYRIAPLGTKPPESLKIAFTNSRFACLAYRAGTIVAAGRAVSDGIDCSYICDLAVHPDFQGAGLGRTVVEKLLELSSGCRKILLYAVPGKEAFYKRFGFMRMRTAMAIFPNQERAVAAGLLDEN
jgi:ribosomal protein S18 acetylase RimI-like enzyme